MPSTRIFSSPFLGGLPAWLAHPVGVLLVMLLVLSSSALGAEEGDFVYERAGVGARVTGYRGSGGAVVIPERLGGLPVTSIWNNAFNKQTSLTSVTIPDSVTSIGEGAFASCWGLTNVTIPNSVTSIGVSAFYYCSSLTSVTIPNSVTSIRDSAFSYCTSLTSVTIPNSVTSIEPFAFFYCSSLTSITIPDSVTSIGARAFSFCGSLTRIEVDPLNSQYGGLEGVLFNKGLSVLLQYPAAKAGSSYSIPNSVTSIGTEAFHNCTGLTVVTIPNSVTSIGGSAFQGCTGLTSVTIPNSVSTIGDYAFYGCTGLTSVTIPDSVTSIGDGAFANCTGLTSVTIPDSVTTIGGDPDPFVVGQFSGCTGLTSITIPNSVTTIGYRAFANCTGLTSVTIPASVTSIGHGAFEGCTGLTRIEVDPLNSEYVGLEGVLFNKGLSVLLHYPWGKAGSYTIPDSVTSIGDGAFSNCTGLTSVTIPNSVTSIGQLAFSGCTGLTGLYFQGRPPELPSEDPLEGAEQVTVYHLPGSTGWDSTFGGRPTALWLPQMRNVAARFGAPENPFAFDVSWAPGQTVVVEAATDLAAPVWSPVQTLTLSGDSIHFSDPEWTNHPTRLYRLRTP